MNSRLKKVYKLISVIVLGLCIYGMALPLISPLLERLIPGIWTCPFLRITGQPCPFCGLTRGVSDLYRLEFSGVSLLSMIVFMVVLIESAFRLMVIVSISALKERTVKILAGIDIAWHLLLSVILAIYVIIYLIIKF